jgi:hypothetical protein
MIRRPLLYAVLAAMYSAVLAGQSAPVAPPAATPSDAQIEEFLLHARIVKTRGVSKGITGTVRATLSDGTLTHDAQIQTVDERMAQFVSQSGTEFNFRDSWTYNVAAYRLDRLIGLQMIPVSVSRDWQSKGAAFTWWVDDVLMDEEARMKKRIVPPDMAAWNEQLQLVRVLDQLIYNIDRNLGNLLITRDWRVWAIDHTRAFRTHKVLKSPANITRCDRQVLEGLKRLDAPMLKKSLGPFLTQYEIDGILGRRDAIVALLDKRGPAVLFDRQAFTH